MVGGGLGLTAESLDQLKAWLRSCLLDAYGWGSDCESLMKYVVALVKKDRSAEELRSDCLEQLRVFFNDNTVKFVNELFECLESKAYLEPYGTKSSGDRSKKEGDEQVDKSAGAEGLAFIVDKKPDPMIVSMANKDKERDEKTTTIRDRSRSRSRERSKDKERSRSPHLAPTQRRRSRSPLRRSRSPPPRRFRSRSRSRSRERYRGGRKGWSRSPPGGRHRTRITTRHSRSRSRSPAPPPPPPPLRDLRDTLTRKHNNSSMSGHLGSGRRERCRDFDEQGFCIQGELCPFDHGTDPVILDSTVPPPYNPTLRGGNGVPIPPVVPEYNPLEPDMRHPHPQQPPHGPPHDHPVHPHAPGHHHLGGAGPYGPGAGVGGNWNYQPGPPGHPPVGGGGPHLQREFVTIPRNNLTQVQRTVIAPPHENHSNNPRGPANARFQRGTELEVRRIPRAQNNIAKLNEYFSKFGTITNIQVSFQGCPESALISFSKHHEANSAYRSTEAVLGNRFIKLFWHNTNNSNATSGVTVLSGNQPSHGGNNHYNNNNNNSSVGGVQIKKRLPQQQHGFSGQDDVGGPPKKVTKPNPEALKKDNQADKSAQLISQKSRLYDKYVEENKRLRERFEKSTSEEEKEQIKTLMTNLAKTIESLRPKQAPGALLPEITSEKQLLDAELDLYRQIQAKQGQNPAETRQLEQKLIALRHKAKTLGLLDSANVWQGRLIHKGLLVGQAAAAASALKTSAAGKGHGQLVIDKRPRVIAVLAGQLKMAGLCKHLSLFGKVANVAEEGEGDAKHFLFTFATRKDAEFAVNRGGVFRGVPLKWHWKEEAQQVQPSKANTQKDLGVSEQQRHADSKAKDSTVTDDGDAEEGNLVGPAGDATNTVASSATIATSQASDAGIKPPSAAGAGAAGDGDHLASDTDKLLGSKSCGNVIKDVDACGLLEDDDDDEEARSWRH